MKTAFAKTFATMAAVVLALLLVSPAFAEESAEAKPEEAKPQIDEKYKLQEEYTFSEEEIAASIEGFFAGTSHGLAEILAKAFKENGRPCGYIIGNEAGGAFVVGLRYGEGTLVLKNKGKRKVYWQGPSAGFDFGGNASKVFTLVYYMDKPDQIYQRFPGVDGSAYVVGGFSMNYQKRNGIVLAPIRTGVGLRLGVNIGYLHYTPTEEWLPF